MKTVFIVMGWQAGEAGFISGVFDNEPTAKTYVERMEHEDDYGYQYFIQEWEVR